MPKRRGSTIARRTAPRAPGAPAAPRRRPGGPELDAHARVRGLGVGVGEHRARHAQVLGEVDVALEVPQQVLAAPAQSSLHAPALRARRSSSAGASGRDQRGSRISTCAQPPALDERGELAADRLDLGQLGHAP